MGTQTSSSQYKTSIAYKEMNQLAHWLASLFINGWYGKQWQMAMQTVNNTAFHQPLQGNLFIPGHTSGLMFGLVLSLSPHSCLI